MGMTDTSIRKYINRLNKGNVDESIFTRQISENVDVAKVWDEKIKITDYAEYDFTSLRFFFIKDENGKYVGAVLDMERDLHWYILPKSRKNGYLSKALRETILPYLFYDGRDSQRITISVNTIGEKNYSNSKKVALSFGFKQESDSEFVLDKGNFDWSYENLNEKNYKIKEERTNELQRRVSYASKLLYKVSDELLMAYGNDEGLHELKDETKRFINTLIDLEMRFEE